jgi:hypothetical protein
MSQSPKTEIHENIDAGSKTNMSRENPKSEAQTQTVMQTQPDTVKIDYYTNSTGRKVLDFIIGLFVFILLQTIGYYVIAVGFSALSYALNQPWIMTIGSMVASIVLLVVQVVFLVWVATKRKFIMIGFVGGFVLSICLSILLFGSCLLFVAGSSYLSANPL